MVFGNIFFYDQNVKISLSYDNDIKKDERYLTLSDNLFSGDFIYMDNVNGIKEIRKIKDGLINGKTVYFDLSTNKVLKKENYKSGELN